MSDIVFKVKKEEIDTFLPICNKCKNHINRLNCLAFNVIPDSILFQDNNHSQPLPNQDNNITFEPIENDK